jgi:RNA polymerase sigma-70 factor (ECF subfamily)
MHSLVENNRSAVTVLYQQRKAFLCFYAMGMVGSYQEAEDIVHSVFEKILSKESLPEGSAFDSYVVSAVRNSCLNHISRQKTHGKYTSYVLKESESSEDRDYVNSRMEAEILWEIFSKIEELPDGCRQVFKMSYLENLSNQEIADALGISVNTVKSQKARSKELLRASLADLFTFAALIFGL